MPLLQPQNPQEKCDLVRFEMCGQSRKNYVTRVYIAAVSQAMLDPAKSTLLFTGGKLLLVALVLFCVGPQLGSLDVDGDGIPEVPVIVSTAPTGPRVAQVCRPPHEALTPAIPSSRASGSPTKEPRARTRVFFSLTGQFPPLRC